MPQMPRETVEQVLATTDIVDLIGAYLPIKRAGSRFQALCPFHQEKTPSFSIDPVRQRYHCFGCKAGGDAISFVREHEGLTFTDAVRKLAGRVGIAVETQSADPREERERRARGRLLDLHREVSRYYHELLLTAPAAAHARDYLKSRGFGSEMAKRWEIGWAPPADTFAAWARGKNLAGRDLVDSGIALKQDRGGLYFRFRDRLMFPIRNDHGDVIAFSGRQLREDPRSGKYINSPETSLFKKSNVLFALDRARKGILDAKHVLLCEGQIDAIACHERGITHAIAPLGTAFTPQHAKNLRRYTKEAVLCFDADSAGFTAVERAYRELAAAGLAVRVVTMPAGQDPDSFMREHGADAFRERLGSARNFFDFRIARAHEAKQLEGPQERADFARECADQLAAIGDHVTRDSMINHVATRLRVGVNELRDAVRRGTLKQSRRPARRAAEDSSAPARPAPEPAPLDPRIGYLCTLALRAVAARDWLGEQFETLHELADHLDGIPLLQAILSGRPDPDSPASINGFLAALSEPDRLAIEHSDAFAEGLPEDPRAGAEATLAEASAMALEKRDARIKAALADDSLPFERQIELLNEAKEVAELLSGLSGRALTTARFDPVRKRRERPNSRKPDDFSAKRKP
jgi:DNA primase